MAPRGFQRAVVTGESRDEPLKLGGISGRKSRVANHEDILIVSFLGGVAEVVASRNDHAAIEHDHLVVHGVGIGVEIHRRTTFGKEIVAAVRGTRVAALKQPSHPHARRNPLCYGAGQFLARERECHEVDGLASLVHQSDERAPWRIVGTEIANDFGVPHFEWALHSARTLAAAEDSAAVHLLEFRRKRRRQLRRHQPDGVIVVSVKSVVRQVG